MPSDINVAAETLRTLHRIHRQLNDLQERLRRGPNLVKAHQSNVARCEQQLAKLQSDAKALRVATDGKQGQLGDGEAKVAKLHVQLNTAGSNREYQALQEQIAAVQMTNSVLADEILEALEKVDDYSKKAVVADAALKKARAEAEKAQREVAEQKPLITGDIQRLERELAECETALPVDFRSLYQRVVLARGEDAMAVVQNEYCDGCHQHVPLNMINDLLLAKPIFCKACGRLLYLPEDHATA